MGTQLVMYDEEYNRINAVCDRLTKDANAKVVFIVDKNGQLIAASGDLDNLDTTSLASLTAGNIAATGGIAKLLKENEFATQFHEGERANIHIKTNRLLWSKKLDELCRITPNFIWILRLDMRELDPSEYKWENDKQQTGGHLRLRCYSSGDEVDRMMPSSLAKLPLMK